MLDRVPIGALTYARPYRGLIVLRHALVILPAWHLHSVSPMPIRSCMCTSVILCSQVWQTIAPGEYVRTHKLDHDGRAPRYPHGFCALLLMRCRDCICGSLGPLH